MGPKRVPATGMMTLAWLVASPVAWAGDCEAPYDLDTLADDMGAVESAVISDDSAAAEEAARRLQAGLACLDTPLPRVIAGRAYRALATGVVSVEPDTATQWYRTAAAVDSGFVYTLEDLPRDDHPAFEAWRTALDEVAGVDEALIEGHVWSTGKFTVDGRRMSWPAAEPDMPHVLQRAHDGAVTTWIVDGISFPEEALIADASVGQPVVGDGPSSSLPVGVRPTVTVNKVESNNWPAERIALVGGGTAALAVGGVLYGLAWDKRSQFDASSKQADTERLAASTNTLTVASTATLAAGAGTVGFGILFFIVDGDPRPTLDLRF